jgi:CheY-like chemotaxis protein
MLKKEKAMNALRKVLVVDDDPAVRKSIDRVLTGKGYAVITAENGEEAMRKLNEEKYDLVYTDIRMPGMSGLEVAEQVKARRPWTPVVIITGYGTDAAEARAKAAGVSSFVHKPLSPEMIEGSARDALAAPAAQVLALPAAAEAPLAEPAATGSALLNILLFFAAPFIGLAYIIALPFVGLGVMAVLAARVAAKIAAVRTIGLVLKHTAMVFAAPVIGLAYVVLFPFLGLAALVWLGGRAVVGGRRTAE